MAAAHSSGGLSGSGSDSLNSNATTPVRLFACVMRFACGTFVGSSNASMTVWAPILCDTLLVSGVMDMMGVLALMWENGFQWVGCVVFVFALCRVVATVLGCVYVVIASFVCEIFTVSVCVWSGAVSVPKGQRIVCVSLFFILFVFASVTSRSGLLWMRIA